jgi:hypothetical protein
MAAPNQTLFCSLRRRHFEVKAADVDELAVDDNYRVNSLIAFVICVESWGKDVRGSNRKRSEVLWQP